MELLGGETKKNKRQLMKTKRKKTKRKRKTVDRIFLERYIVNFTAYTFRLHA